MDLALDAELRLAGGYADTLTPKVIARILAWERACERLRCRVYITKPVAMRAKEGAFGVYGGSFMRDPNDRARWRVRW